MLNGSWWTERRFLVQPRSVDRRSGKERRGGSDRRKSKDRRKFEDRRTGKDRRNFNSPDLKEIKRQESEGVAEDPVCQRCIAILGEMQVLILECPLPEKICGYKQNFAAIHYVTYPTVRVENCSAVVASSPESLLSSSIILMRPDPILKENQIYYIDITDSHSL
jgi:hypothetical protein